MRKKYLTLLFLLLVYNCALAHSAMVSSTEFVQQVDKTWQLRVKAALSAHEFEVTQQFGRGAFKDTTDFKKLLVKHALNHLSVKFSEGGSASLLNGRVELGHESIVIFDIKSMPKNLHSITVHNSMFEQIKGNQNTLSITSKEFTRQRSILNEGNNFTQEVSLQRTIKSTANERQYNSKILAYALGIVLFIILGFAFRKKYNQPRSAT